jgi:hypothetical protein
LARVPLPRHTLAAFDAHGEKKEVFVRRVCASTRVRPKAARARKILWHGRRLARRTRAAAAARGPEDNVFVFHVCVSTRVEPKAPRA